MGENLQYDHRFSPEVLSGKSDHHYGRIFAVTNSWI
ncbi:MAG: hypothetical protein JWR18_2759 [Segetibacter sp.]|jgi:hypothetical protein|nr:hypothetical protein [Segetibacter sp.]